MREKDILNRCLFVLKSEIAIKKERETSGHLELLFFFFFERYRASLDGVIPLLCTISCKLILQLRRRYFRFLCYGNVMPPDDSN